MKGSLAKPPDGKLEGGVVKNVALNEGQDEADLNGYAISNPQDLSLGARGRFGRGAA